MQDILPRVPRRHVTYGVSPQSDYAARGIQFRGLETSFNAYRRGEPLGGFTVKMPGAPQRPELPGDHRRRRRARGAARRHEAGARDLRRRGTALHHRRPARGGHPRRRLRPPPGRDPRHHRGRAARVPGEGNRVVVAFQPHRHTRTRDLFDDFTRAFNQADVLFVTDIYAAGEAPIPGVIGRAAGAGHPRARAPRRRYVADKNDLPEALERVVRPGDVVIALGAGDINNSVRRLKTRLDAREGGGKTPPPAPCGRGRREREALGPPAGQPAPARRAEGEGDRRARGPDRGRRLAAPRARRDDGAALGPRRPPPRALRARGAARARRGRSADDGGRGRLGPLPLRAAEPTLRGAHGARRRQPPAERRDGRVRGRHRGRQEHLHDRIRPRPAPWSRRIRGSSGRR